MKHVWMEWKECGIVTAFQFAEGKTIKRNSYAYDIGVTMNHPEGYNCDCVVFTDGTAVACLSQWRGPYSEVTPDIDAEPPKWWIGKPAIGRKYDGEGE